MKLTVLCDNFCFIDRYFLAEPALSFYIENEGDAILFDMGYGGVFIDNAEKMGLDLRNVRTAVFSHGHNDHTGGLEPFSKQYDTSKLRIVAHPETFEPKYHEGEYIGSPVLTQQLSESCRLELTKQPAQISQNLFFLGEIPRVTSFETNLFDGGVPDDSALVYRGADGMFIITGCSHSGICSIVERAKELFGDDRITGIIGGFHLFEADAQTLKTAEYFKENNVSSLYPCHCVSFAAKAAINAVTPIIETGVGTEVTII